LTKTYNYNTLTIHLIKQRPQQRQGTRKVNKNNDLTTKQVIKALDLLIHGWVNMTGEDFAKHALNMKHEKHTTGYINQNFKRFQDDLGAQLCKTSGDYKQRLATGLIDFYNESQPAKKPYYILAINYGKGFEWIRSSHKLSEILAYKYEVLKYCNSPLPITKIIKTIKDQDAISKEINKLNEEH
jgi:hypothetical protein